MPKKGGYKIVSLHKIDLLGESLVLAGIYLALINSYDKPIMLSDINIDGEIKKDALVQAEKGQNKVTIKNLYGYDLEISNEDAINVSESSIGIELPIPTPEDDDKIVGVNVEGKYVLKAPSALPYVRKMTAPSSTILTDEEIEQIKGGVFIDGEYLGLKNPILFPTDSNNGVIFGESWTTSSVFAQYNINETTKEITLYAGKRITLNKDGGVELADLSKVNGKNVPVYPSSTGSFTLKCVDGVLTWVADQA